MEFFIVVVYPLHGWKRRRRKKNKKGKSFLNIDIKSLIEKCLELLFKTFRTSFTGDSVSPRAYKFIKSFIYCNNFMFASATQSEWVLINVFRWLKFHSKTFSNPFFQLPNASTTAESHYKYLLRAMKTQSKAKRESCCLNQVKIKIGTEKQIYDYCVFCLQGVNVYSYRNRNKSEKNKNNDFTVLAFGWHKKP